MRVHGKPYARVAQLVEYDLAKVGAAGSSPVSRSLKPLIFQGFFVFVLHFVLHGFLTYQGSPTLLSRKGESGGLGDLPQSGVVQAPSDKLRQQHREMRKQHSGGCASPFPGIPNFLWPKQADAFLPFPGQGQGGQGGWFQGWRKEAIRSRHRLGGSRSRFPADGPSGSGHIKGQ